MKVLQLVSHTRPKGQSELFVVPNPYEREPDSFESATERPVLIGSQQLIMLAAGLCGQGFRAMEAALTDRNFTRLEDPDSVNLSDKLVESVNSTDLSRIEQFMRLELPGIYVESIRLLDASKRGTILLRQEGIIITSPNVNSDDLSRTIRTAAGWSRAS